jgi:DNA-binding MarR family transcriptional regulator
VPAKRGSPLHDLHRYGVLVRDSARLFRRLLRDDIAAYDLSFNQYLVLREVYDVPRISQRVLSTNVGVAEPTIVATADALVARGFLLRERSKIDRRQTHLILTPAGRAVAVRLVRRALEINRFAVRDMTEREAQMLRVLLIRANESLLASIEAPATAPKRRK